MWMCPSIQLAAADINGSSFLMGGSFGFFCYQMNLDLKLKTSVNNGVADSPAGVGNSIPWPGEGKLGALRLPSATVLLTETLFSPTLESYPGEGTGNQNGAFPSSRWNYFSQRHNARGTLSFTDGHSQIYKWSYVYNPAGGRVELFNPDIWWNPHRDIP